MYFKVQVSLKESLAHHRLIKLIICEELKVKNIYISSEMFTQDAA